MPYLTPDDSGGTILCRRLRFREELASFITGALEMLSHPYVWEQYGDMTVAQMTSLATEALNYYLESGDSCMAGQLWFGLTASVPEDVLELDGATYLDADYPLLAAAIDAAYDNGDGTFTLPDARGRVGVGAGAGAGLTARALGDSFGVETVTLTEAEIPSHQHSYANAGFPELPVIVPGEGLANAFSGPDLTGATGGGDPHQNMQPSIVWRVGVYWK